MMASFDMTLESSAAKVVVVVVSGALCRHRDWKVEDQGCR